jgi:hypothetical protein
VTRSHRGIFAVVDNGIEDKWWHLEITQDESEENGYKLRLESPGGDFWTSDGSNAWDALQALRTQVEPLGYRLCCNGSRVDAYASGMAISMAGGGLVYILRSWRRPRTKDLVEIFTYAPPGKVGTIAEQEQFFNSWTRRWWTHLL